MVPWLIFNVVQLKKKMVNFHQLKQRLQGRLPQDLQNLLFDLLDTSPRCLCGEGYWSVPIDKTRGRGVCCLKECFNFRHGSDKCGVAFRKHPFRKSIYLCGACQAQVGIPMAGPLFCHFCRHWSLPQFMKKCAGCQKKSHLECLSSMSLCRFCLKGLALWDHYPIR